jgi:hypothetical protein
MNLRVVIAVNAAHRTTGTRQAAGLAERSGLHAVAGAFFEIELPFIQCRRRATGNADPVTAGLAWRLGFNRFARLECGIRHHQGAIGKPSAPLGIDADLERRRVMPARKLTQTLQPYRVRTWIDDFAGVFRLACGEPVPHGLNAEIIDRVFRIDSRCGDAFPEFSARVADQDELARRNRGGAGGPDRCRQVRRKAVDIEDRLPVQAGGIEQGIVEGLQFFHGFRCMPMTAEGKSCSGCERVYEWPEDNCMRIRTSLAK